MKVALGICFVLFCSSFANAYECKRTEWPYAQTMPKKDMQVLLESLPRQYVMEFFLFEVTSVKPKVELEKKLGHFLYHTETVKEYRSMIEIIRDATAVPTSGVRSMKMADLCVLMKKVESYRDPTLKPGPSKK